MEIQHSKVEKVEDISSTFICALIPASDTQSIRRKKDVFRRIYPGTAQSARRTRSSGEVWVYPVPTRSGRELEYVLRYPDIFT